MTLVRGESISINYGIFRELRAKSHLNKQDAKPLRGAFIPRPKIDLNGLSLTLHAEGQDPYQCVARYCFGLADLELVKIKRESEEIIIVYDGGRHCLLKGIPTQINADHELSDDEICLQEKIADVLVECSVFKPCSIHQASDK